MTDVDKVLWLPDPNLRVDWHVAPGGNLGLQMHQNWSLRQPSSRRPSDPDPDTALRSFLVPHDRRPRLAHGPDGQYL